jgi:hypothetical protein
LDSVPGADLAIHQVVDFRLEGAGPGTRLSLSGTTRYQGFWLRVLEPMATWSVARTTERNLSRLKRIVESERGK